MDTVPVCVLKVEKSLLNPRSKWLGQALLSEWLRRLRREFGRLR